MGECLGGYGVMGVYGGPNVVEDGLVLALDGGNSKGYDNDENLVTDNATDFNYSFNNQIIPTANDVAPNGTTVLCKHDLTGATSPFLNCRANTTLNAGTYTMSMYLKGTTSFNASFAFVGETTSEIYANTENITTEWKRFTLTFTLVNTQTSSRLQVFFATQGNDKIISVWGAQLERGSVATDYTTRLSGTAKNRGTTWTDLSGNGNNGTLVNGVGYSSDNLGSLVFDGVDDYTNHSPILSSGQQRYTISAWWKTSVNNRIQVVWEQNSSASTTNTRAALIFINANWGFNGQNNDAHDKVPVRINQWTNGVITIDTTLGTNPVKIYENGSLYWEGNTSGSASNLNVGNFASGLGRKISSNSEYFVGNIANTSIYNRALTASEIQQNFIATRSRFGI
jgi:hypothetical protein